MPECPIILRRSLNRFAEIYSKDTPGIPAALLSVKNESPVPYLARIPLPLPSRRSSYSCAAPGANGTVWLGAANGLTRWNGGAPCKEERIWFFSAPRDLPDNAVKAILPLEAASDGTEIVWILTETGAAKLTLRFLSGEEKANLLLRESLDVVDRRGMFSQRQLSVPYRKDMPLPYNESDNDGCFGCGFAIAEELHYATLARELGETHPETQRVRAIATRAAEAMLLLMYIPGRGDGFVARTYLTPREPVPDGGYYFRKRADGLAECLPTASAVHSGRAGVTVKASAAIPARLAKLCQAEGSAGTGIVYKGDTSSDEITLHFAHLYFLHITLGKLDAELDALAIQAGKALLRHIIDHGMELQDCFGGPTTWAKWSLRYFNGGGSGWCDAPLNAAELLMYLRVMIKISGETEPWQGVYDSLLAQGYGDLPAKHRERLCQCVMAAGLEECEDIMYGDHMLATMAFWLLLLLTPEDAVKAKLRAGFASWRSSIGREWNPGYDFPYALACPGAALDFSRLERWFYRSPASRLAAGVNVAGRHDMPKRTCRGGSAETGWLLPDDERFIAKYDRNPNDYPGERGSASCVESGYVYTFAYWIGRYYGFLRDA
ncbi:MAG: hypothetical protein LBC83_08655 [Oscillospiraceae bacterium]|jgi:hypothetical protein|nr:hypothetical protein [Oscillospiraceae bacterium]